MTQRDKEALPYRTAVPAQLPTAESSTTRDEEQYDTLRQVYLIMETWLADIDKWHAFGKEKETELKIKQQIHAHGLAFDLVQPLFDSITSAMATVNQKYKEG